MFKFYAQPNYPDIKVWWRIFNTYYGPINIFKPTIAMSVYCRYKSKSILDPTMGWSYNCALTRGLRFSIEVS